MPHEQHIGLGQSTEEGFRAEVAEWLDANRAHAPSLNAEPTAAPIEHWRAWSASLHRAGLVGITWPAAHGGRGLPRIFEAIWLEERARAGVPDHLGVIGVDMAGPTIIEWGTSEQKERFLEPILRCDEIWCQGFSEPGSGSDLASASLAATREGAEWVLTGQKVWSSFAHLADWCILLGRTDPTVGKHNGLSYFLVDMHLPGVEVRPLPQITGDAEFSEIFFTSARVPEDAMLGAPGDGWRVAMTTLGHERGTHGVKLGAELEAEFHAASSMLGERRLDGSRPLDDPAVRDALAEIWIDLRALRAASIDAVSSSDDPGPEATIAKLNWSELNQHLTALVGDNLGHESLRLGGDALAGGHWCYARLRARGNTIEAGTSEVLRNIVAERVLGLPRSR